MTERIRSLLHDIYSPDVAKDTYPALLALLDEARSQLGTASADARPAFSERDVALITYGDTLQQADEAPLATLHRFLKTHLSELLSIVHILPFFPYSSDDGFSILDYEAVDPQLGTWDDVQHIARDFRLMVDLVLNHMSAQSEWFKTFLAGHPDYAGLFLTESPQADLSDVTRPRASSLLTPFQTAGGQTVHVWTTFSPDQVDFDYRSPATLLRMLGVLLFYVEQGAAVIRLDAVAYLWKELGTTSIHLPQTHAVIRLMRAVLDVVAPHVWLVTETNVPHAENVSYFGAGHDEAQMVYNFTLPPLLLYTMTTGDTRQLRDWINSLQPPSQQTTFFNFTASHDGIGVRPLEGVVALQVVDELAAQMQARGGLVSYKANPDGSQSPYELNITYVDAVTTPDADDATRARQFLVTQAIMLALAGVPAIYIHSLLGSRNDRAAVDRLGYNRAINRAKLNADDIEAALADEGTFRARVFRGYARLLTARRGHPAFNPNAAQTALDVGNPGVLALLRTAASGQRVLALHNVTGQPQTISLADSGLDGGADLLSEATLRGETLTLAPYAVHWLEAGQG